MMHYNRKSFLNRDTTILKKLASLSKAGNDSESVLNTAKGKGNYVFVATEKTDVSHKFIHIQYLFRQPNGII